MCVQTGMPRSFGRHLSPSAHWKSKRHACPSATACCCAGSMQMDCIAPSSTQTALSGQVVGGTPEPAQTSVQKLAQTNVSQSVRAGARRADLAGAFREAVVALPLEERFADSAAVARVRIGRITRRRAEAVRRLPSLMPPQSVVSPAQSKLLLHGLPSPSEWSPEGSTTVAPGRQ